MDTKALRQKILDLAIRGKLVPQDPNDEPASVLLERIRAEKQQMVKDGKLKAKDIKSDSVIYIGDDNCAYEKFPDGTVKYIQDEIPFELPEGWCWCNLSMIGQTNIGLTYHPTDVSTNGTIVLRSSNIINGKLDFIDLVRVTTNIRENQYVEDNDILICARNGSKALVGKCALIKNMTERASFGAFMAIYRTQFYEYVYYYLNSTQFREVFYDGNSTAINQLTQAMIKSARIPFPPKNEQSRIVTKLKELFSLIDTIEQDKTDLQDTIQLTKSKILDLAIRGNLVPQDPNDEPASVLLERIRAEKEELIKQSKIKRDNKESVIFRGDDNSYYEKIGDTVSCIDDELPFDIPDSWAWTRLSSACLINPKNSIADDILVSFVPMTLIKDGYSNKYASEQRTWTEVKKGFTHFAENDVGFAKISPCFENRKSVVFQGLCNGYGAGTTELHILRTFSETILPEYLLYLVKSDLFISGGSNTFSGVVGQQRIGKDYVYSFLCPVPPLSEQKKIIKKCSDIMTMLHNIEKSLS